MLPAAPRTMQPGTVAGALGIAALAGLGLPLSNGLLWPLLAIAGVALLAEGYVRARALAHGTAEGGRADAVWSGSWARGLAMALPLLLATVVVTTVAVRGVASVIVAFPAAVWGLAAALFGGIVLTWVPGRGPQRLVAFAFAVIVPVAGLAGQRWEAAGTDARGWAFTGTMLGIHPFQTTAVIVDGYGPHDIPVNDYVEPDGAKGYGPDEVAAALQHSIRAIGRLHYADGPAQAAMAFENVRVVAASTPAPLEDLGRDSPAELSHRMIFYSGTTGQPSRVQFVCPGQRQDPRGVQPDTVANPMCPSKYITEASAGLSVTGRWAGYTEARGNERLGLARLLGWGVRTDDGEGGRLIEREIRWGAWLLLAGLLASALRRQSRDAVSYGLSAVSGAIAVAVLLIGGWLMLGQPSGLAVPWTDTAPAWANPGVAAWTPALAIGAIAIAGVGSESRPSSLGMGVRLGALPVLLATLACARALGGTVAATPVLYATPDGLALQSTVAGIADVLWRQRFGFSDWTVLEVEAMVASALCALLVGAALAMLSTWGQAIHPSRAALARLRRTRWAALPAMLRRAGVIRVLGIALAVAISALVVVSRKTAGASALLPSAMALMLVYGGCTTLAAPLPARWRRVAAVVHLALVVLAAWVVIASTADLPAHRFVTACRGLGVASCLVALVLLAPNAAPRRGSGA